MKIRQSSTYQSSSRWLGLALACGTLIFAVTTQAGKPVKPPPPPGPAYVPVLLGGLRSSEGGISTSASDLNNAGQVVGNTCIPGYPSTEYSQAFLLNPRDTNGDGKPDTRFVDAVNNATGAPGPDGQNDLIIGLGNLPGAHQGQASAVNDLGLVVGISYFYDPLTGESRTGAFIVVPSGPDWYQESNGDGFNHLMSPLGSLPGNGEACVPNDINNLGQIVGKCGGMDANGVYQLAGFLLTPVKDEAGVWQWFQDDGSGANALMLDLGTFIPQGINDSGRIVGHSGGQAMLRNPDGLWIDLKAGGTESEAVAINNRGQIGLCVHLTSDPVNDWRASLLTPVDTNNDGKLEWFWDANSDGVNDLIVDLGTAQKLRSSGIAAHGLNDAGSVAGVSWTIVNPPRFTPSDKRVPYLWQNGVMQTLKDLTGGTMEFWNVSALNNAGQIVCAGPGAFYDNGSAYILLPSR